MISSLLNIAYLIPVVARAFFVPPPEGEENVGIQEAPVLCVAPICFTATGCLVLFFYAGDLYRLLSGMVQP